MIKTTKWYPDTCKCEIEYEWDDSVSEDVRTHTVTTVKPCSYHALGTDSEKYNLVVKENALKNKSVTELANQLPLVKADDVQFNFDVNRKLALSVKGMNLKNNTLLQVILNQKFGGDVTVE